MSKPITVLIADDHPLFRTGLRHTIEGGNNLTIVAEASDGEDALTKLRELQPTVAVLDIDMPVRNGFEIAKIVQRENLSTAIVFLTMYKEEDVFNESMDLGIRGYVLKDSAGSDVVACIKVVAKGEYFISPSISGYLVTRTEKLKRFLREVPGIQSLTAMERRILKRVSENRTSKEIAEELFISPKTVENHRANIARKLNLHGSHALLKFALENKSRL